MLTASRSLSRLDSVALTSQEFARHLRRYIIERSYRGRAGHIGSALCVADILAVLYAHTLRIENPSDPERDRFVLSKGHAALALYGCVRLMNWIDSETLESYAQSPTILGAHPEHALPGVEYSTGSLGQGITFAVGEALAARLQGSDRKVYALVSDGECNEGSVWEAALCAAHLELDQLVVIIDNNRQQCFGYTKDVMDLSNLAEKWRAFRWDCTEVDGHDVGQMARLFDTLEERTGRPHVVIAHTTFGKGVSFMEAGGLKWHYASMSEAEYQQAMHELGWR